MNPIGFALRRPKTVIVALIALVLVGLTFIRPKRVDDRLKTRGIELPIKRMAIGRRSQPGQGGIAASDWSSLGLGTYDELNLGKTTARALLANQDLSDFWTTANFGNPKLDFKRLTEAKLNMDAQDIQDGIH